MRDWIEKDKHMLRQGRLRDELSELARWRIELKPRRRRPPTPHLQWCQLSTYAFDHITDP